MGQECLYQVLLKNKEERDSLGISGERVARCQCSSCISDPLNNPKCEDYVPVEQSDRIVDLVRVLNLQPLGALDAMEHSNGTETPRFIVSNGSKCVGYYAVEGFAVVPAQARSLGFSAIFAGQDLPAFQKASKEEALSMKGRKFPPAP